MTALDHLRKLVDPEPTFYDGCPYCGLEAHAPDCAFEAAKAHVEEADRNACEVMAIIDEATAACRDTKSSDRPRGMIDNKTGEMTMVEEFCSTPEGKAEFDREKAKLVAEIEKRKTNRTRNQNDHP